MMIQTLLFFLWISARISKQDGSKPTRAATTVDETIQCYVHTLSGFEFQNNHLTTAMLICVSPFEYNVSCNLNMNGTFVCNGSSNEWPYLCDNQTTTNYNNDFDTGSVTKSEENGYDISSDVKRGNECGTTTSEKMASSTSGDVNTCAHAPSNSATVAVLGALVGLLAALLALVTTGWICTYLLMRKRERMNISSEKVRSSADDICLNNPTYSGDDILHLQPPSQAPTYETIQPNPTDGGKLVLTQQGDSEYNVLNRNQNTSTKTASLLETINEDDIEDSYSKLERTATSNGSGRELVNDGDYSNLETLAIESMTTGQAAQSITASEEGGVMNDKARMEENVMEEASTEEGATQLENKVAQKVGEDEGERQGKEEGEEQQVLLLVTTTTDERKFGNGSDNEESDDLSMTTNPSYNNYDEDEK